MKGFFLVELIVVIALISIFTTLSVFGFVNLDYFFRSRSAESEIMTILDRTRNLALSMYQGDGWSFRIENNQAMIFKGSDFSNRNINFDEFYELPAKTFATTTSDIYFAPMTGFSSNATTTINSGTTTVDIIISGNGIVR